MSSRPASIRTKTSAGGVVFSKKDGNVMVVLIRPARGSAVTLPKGEVNEGETFPDAAKREVREETGLEAEIRADLGNVTYWYFLKDENIKFKKTVHFFLMEFTGGSTSDHDYEVEEAAWYGIDDAIKLVTYKTDVEILTKAKEIVLG